MSKIRQLFRIGLLSCVIYLAITMSILPTQCISAGINAIELCLNVVIPSLFPFFICSSLFISLGLAYYCSRFLSPVMRPVFNVPGAGALVFILGIVSGYPVGASCAVNLYRTGQCSKTEAERLLAFCNNSGPLFILGAVGAGMLKNPIVGRYLYISHILSAILVGLIFRFYAGSDNRQSKELPPSNFIGRRGIGFAIGDSISNSVDTILKVCGFVIIFSVFAKTLPEFSGSPFVHGILEITGGVNSFLTIGLPTEIKFSFISFFIGFSGVSVMFQVSSITSPGGLSFKPYFIGKLIQGVISFFITYLLFTKLPIKYEVFSPMYNFPYAGLSVKQLILTSVLMMLWCVLAVLILITVFVIHDKIKRK